MVDPLGVVVFAITYAVISARRLRWLPLDRPAGALLGAVACVALGVLAAIDGATLLLLFGVMGIGAFLARDGFFVAAERWLLLRARTPARLLGMIVWGAGALSALVTNDAVCVLAAPLVVRLVQRHRLPPLPFLLALSTAANTGSVAHARGQPAEHAVRAARRARVPRLPLAHAPRRDPRAGREVGGIGFLSFLRVGVPLTVLTTLVGVAWLLLVVG